MKIFIQIFSFFLTSNFYSNLPLTFLQGTEFYSSVELYLASTIDV